MASMGSEISLSAGTSIYTGATTMIGVTAPVEQPPEQVCDLSIENLASEPTTGMADIAADLAAADTEATKAFLTATSDITAAIIDSYVAEVAADKVAQAPVEAAAKEIEHRAAAFAPKAKAVIARSVSDAAIPLSSGDCHAPSRSLAMTHEAVIARSVSDAAIPLSPRDCFAELTMTHEAVITESASDAAIHLSPRDCHAPFRSLAMTHSNFGNGLEPLNTFNPAAVSENPLITRDSGLKYAGMTTKTIIPAAVSGDPLITRDSGLKHAGMTAKTVTTNSKPKSSTPLSTRYEAIFSGTSVAGPFAAFAPATDITSDAFDVSRPETVASITASIGSGITVEGIETYTSDTGEPNKTLVIKGIVGNAGVLEHYFLEGNGRLTFAGFEEASAAAPALPSILTSGDQSRRVYLDDGLRVLGLGLPGGETAFSQSAFEDPESEAGHYLAALLTGELALGPDHLAEDRMRPSFNSYLQGNPSFGEGHSISQADWQHYLTEIIRLAARHTPLFTNGNIRGISEVRGDMARLLGIDATLLGKWEQHFGMKALDVQLASNASPGFTGLEGVGTQTRLMPLLDRSVEETAAVSLDIQNEEAMSKAFETELEWQAARVSAIADTGAKVASAVQYMGDMYTDGQKRAAARFMALLAKHSDVNEFAAPKEVVAPRWTRVEFSALIQAVVTGEMWELASARTFRTPLSVRENRFVNKAISEAHVHNSIAKVREVDVQNASDEQFWQAVDATGHADDVLFAALMKMVGTIRVSSRGLTAGSHG